MTIGPVQMIVLGFPQPDFHGAVIEELERLGEAGTVRVVDALAVHKDADGGIEIAHLSSLSDEEAIALGTTVGALIGLDIEGEAVADVGDEAVGDDAWDPLEEIPDGSAAAIVLLEHLWAVPLRDAVAAAGGFRIADGFVSPLDLVAVGLLTAEEAARLHALETAPTGATS